MRAEIEKDITRYIDFLRDSGYVVSMSLLNRHLLGKSVLPLLNYDHHLCDVCMFLKSHQLSKDRCFKNKEILNNSQKTGIMYNCCWAGVEEYIFPITISDKFICRVHISGYRNSLPRSKRRYEQLVKQYGKAYISLYKRLSPRVPTQDSLERLIKPLVYMFEKLCKENQPTNEEENEAENLYYKALWFIFEHFAENIKTETVAQAVSYSASHLRAVFQRMNGSTVSEYINLVRLNQASKLLRLTRLPVTKIAYECGFCDGNYFSTVFKKHYGMSPRKYRTTYYQGAGSPL